VNDFPVKNKREIRPNICVLKANKTAFISLWLML